MAYTNATVDMFNRFALKLFHSVGYPKAWDGTYGGKPVPAGVYYYIIDTKVNNQGTVGLCNGYRAPAYFIFRAYLYNPVSHCNENAKQFS